MRNHRDSSPGFGWLDILPGWICMKSESPALGFLGCSQNDPIFGGSNHVKPISSTVQDRGSPAHTASTETWGDPGCRDLAWDIGRWWTKNRVFSWVKQHLSTNMGCQVTVPKVTVDMRNPSGGFGTNQVTLSPDKSRKVMNENVCRKWIDIDSYRL